MALPVSHLENDQNKDESLRKRTFVFWLLGASLVGVDQYIKMLAFNNGVGGFFHILPSFVRQSNFRNYYFAFSLPLPSWLIFIIYGSTLYFIFKYIHRRFQNLSKKDKIAWTLIIAGALSNIGERLVLGYVRDFIFFANGIFNLADCFILLGMIILLFRDIKRPNVS